MERIKKTKKIFTISKISGKFHLEKEYEKKKKTLKGAFSIIPKKDVKIGSVTFELFQTMKMDEETAVVSLGKKTVKWRWEIPAIKGKRMNFEIPVSFSQSKKKQKKIYKGEMALMDRVHDESQKQRYTYEIMATVKITWDNKKIDFSRKISIK